MDYAMCQA
jgi:AhpD family alkylhydroperoxidase